MHSDHVLRAAAAHRPVRRANPTTDRPESRFRASPHRRRVRWAPAAGTDPFVAAVRATRMPMIITDPRLPDNPVVFANDAFCRLTGYRPRRDRRPQLPLPAGPGDRPGDRRRASAPRCGGPSRSRSTSATTARTATPFWNRLLLAPVRDADGAARLFLRQPGRRDARARAAGRPRKPQCRPDGRARRPAAHAGGERGPAALRHRGRAGWASGSWTCAPDELKSSRRAQGDFGRRPRPTPFTYADLRDAVHPDDRERMQAAADRPASQTGTDYAIECRVPRADRRPRWVELRAQVMRAAGRHAAAHGRHLARHHRPASRPRR